MQAAVFGGPDPTAWYSGSVVNVTDFSHCTRCMWSFVVDHIPIDSKHVNFASDIEVEVNLRVK